MSNRRKIRVINRLRPVAEQTSPVDSGDAPEVLMASAAPSLPPLAWFSDPQLEGPTPMTVTDDGRVYGHLATWGTCHTGHAHTCLSVPHSESDYSYFHVGGVKVKEGDTIGVGHITMGTGHAGEKMDPTQTLAHYENTGNVVADVRAGEDAYGVWIAGAIRPGKEGRIRELRGAPLSGDWRRVNMSSDLELIAALAVNVPGFPIPRPKGLVASGALQSLVASGVVVPSTAEENTELAAAVSTFRGFMDDAHEVFDTNPDRWRVPKGNGAFSGRWIDMPGLSFGIAIEYLMDDDTVYGKISSDPELVQRIRDFETAARGMRSRDLRVGSAEFNAALESGIKVLEDVKAKGSLPKETGEVVDKSIEDMRTFYELSLNNFDQPEDALDTFDDHPLEMGDVVPSEDPVDESILFEPEDLYLSVKGAPVFSAEDLKALRFLVEKGRREMAQEMSAKLGETLSAIKPVESATEADTTTTKTTATQVAETVADAPKEPSGQDDTLDKIKAMARAIHSEKEN